MKSYKTVVIDGKKLIRRGVLCALIMTVVGLLSVGVRLSEITLSEFGMLPERSIAESFPTIRGFEGNGMKISSEIWQGFRSALRFVMSFDVMDPKSVVSEELPLVKAVSGGYLARRASEAVQSTYNPENADVAPVESQPLPGGEGAYPIKEVDSGQAKALGEGKILIRNDTDYGINIEQMLNEPLKFGMSGQGAKILIVHTHATECYSPEGSDTYDSDKSDRSMDCNENVVRVGAEMKKIFEEKGIAVIHDTTLHDHPNFNGSYENSRKTVERHLKENPGIVIVLDVHRDAFLYEDSAKAKFVTEIDNKKTAQLMFVIGTNAGGLEHPYWRENMKLALKFQNRICAEYPNLMRGVNLRKERFNGHTTYGSMIIEVGSSGNTLDEAIRGAKLCADEMAEYLNNL